MQIYPWLCPYQLECAACEHLLEYGTTDMPVYIVKNMVERYETVENALSMIQNSLKARGETHLLELVEEYSEKIERKARLKAECESKQWSRVNQGQRVYA